MAYSNTAVSVLYLGNNVQTVFPISFDYVEDSGIKVELWDVTDPLLPVEVPIVEGVDWFVNGTDVEMTVAPTADHKVLIYRDMVAIHDTLYSTYEFPYNTANFDLDKIYQVAQENKEALSRAIINSRFTVENGGTVVTIDDFIQLIQDVADFDARITVNEAGIASNQADIVSNDAELLDHENRISQNEADVQAILIVNGDHENRITQNEVTLANHENRILVLEAAPSTPPIITIANVAGNIVAVPNNRIIVKSNGVTIDLPTTPTANNLVLVKVRGTYSTKPIISGNGNNIDGAANFTILSDESSYEFLYDGTEWVII